MDFHEHVRKGLPIPEALSFSTHLIEEATGNTLLHTALECGNTTLVPTLVRQINLSATNVRGQTPLDAAIACTCLPPGEHATLLKTLLSGCQQYLVNSIFQPRGNQHFANHPLYPALFHGQLYLVEPCLEAGMYVGATFLRDALTLLDRDALAPLERLKTKEELVTLVKRFPSRWDLVDMFRVLYRGPHFHVFFGSDYDSGMPLPGCAGKRPLVSTVVLGHPELLPEAWHLTKNMHIVRSSALIAASGSNRTATLKTLWLLGGYPLFQPMMGKLFATICRTNDIQLLAWLINKGERGWDTMSMNNALHLAVQLQTRTGAIHLASTAIKEGADPNAEMSYRKNALQSLRHHSSWQGIQIALLLLDAGSDPVKLPDSVCYEVLVKALEKQQAIGVLWHQRRQTLDRCLKKLLTGKLTVEKCRSLFSVVEAKVGWERDTWYKMVQQFISQMDPYIPGSHPLSFARQEDEAREEEEEERRRARARDKDEQVATILALVGRMFRRLERWNHSFRTWALLRATTMASDVVSHVTRLATSSPLRFGTQYYKRIGKKGRHQIWSQPLVLEFHLNWGARFNDIVAQETQREILTTHNLLHYKFKHPLLYDHLMRRFRK